MKKELLEIRRLEGIDKGFGGSTFEVHGSRYKTYPSG
jgi:hypothetical protein